VCHLYAFVPSVADGVDHFKHGRLTEAMQMFNKALQIDADNVDALVARGALYVDCCAASVVYVFRADLLACLSYFVYAVCHECVYHVYHLHVCHECAFCRSYANSESYRRALEDFDAALAVNPDHANARKYTCDTLLALARRYMFSPVLHIVTVLSTCAEWCFEITEKSIDVVCAKSVPPFSTYCSLILVT